MPELSNLPALRFFLLLLVLLTTVGAAAQAAHLAAGIWFTQLAILLLPAIVLAKACNLAPASLLRFRFKLELRLLALILVAASANYLVAAGAMALMEQIIPSHWPRVDAAAVLEMEKGASLAFVIAAVVLLAPLCEEAAFRGFMQQPLTARYGPWPGILAAAFLFSILHMDPVGFLSRLELGVLFGWLLWRTGSLWAPILAHLVNNGVATLLFFATRHLDQDAVDPAGGLVVLTALAFIVLGLAVLAPALVLIHRSTRERSVANPEAAIRPIDTESPVGLSPRASVGLSFFVLVLTFSIALALLAGVAANHSEKPPLATPASATNPSRHPIWKATASLQSRQHAPYRCDHEPGSSSSLAVAAYHQARTRHADVECITSDLAFHDGPLAIFEEPRLPPL